MDFSKLEKISVLIVDDETLIQRLVHDVLEDLGFRKIVIANSGRKAIELLKLHPFDFVITDWRMDDMEGIDLIKHIRKSPESPNPRIPVILLTGNTEAHYILTARDEGVNEYVIKPFTAEKLVKHIRNIIEHPRCFIDSPVYKGPDRRFHDAPVPGGQNRRKRNKKNITTPGYHNDDR